MEEIWNVARTNEGRKWSVFSLFPSTLSDFHFYILTVWKVLCSLVTDKTRSLICKRTTFRLLQKQWDMEVHKSVQLRDLLQPAVFPNFLKALIVPEDGSFRKADEILHTALLFVPPSYGNNKWTTCDSSAELQLIHHDCFKINHSFLFPCCQSPQMLSHYPPSCKWYDHNSSFPHHPS